MIGLRDQKMQTIMKSGSVVLVDLLCLCSGLESGSGREVKADGDRGLLKPRGRSQAD